MSKFFHALRVLFPLSAVPVSTVPSEVEARALATLLVARGRRAVFHRSASGYTVEVLA